ncbi:MAG TPA: squalene--hopene cyclase [Thermoanaerobaculia bacterium]|nr:squalene--hopene cyclase [Thermoanaerobaculia bacterium]
MTAKEIRGDGGGPPEEGSLDVGAAAAAARRYLLSIQREDGHWCGELEGDTILESEYMLTMHFLGRAAEPRIRKAAEYLRRQQLPGGGWAIYPGGPAEVSSSAKAYFALKLVGDDLEAPHMAKARRVVLELGGLDACNSFTKIYLSIFGQYEWEKCPVVPPELVLLPDAFPISIYKMSSWSRAIVVPLSVISAYRPTCAVPDGAGISELRTPPGTPQPVRRQRSLRERSWASFFDLIDRLLHAIEKRGWTPLRKRALAQAEEWILERLERSDGLGAIFPPIINTILALRCRGYAADHPLVAGQVEELLALEIEEEETVRLQPCFSPVWDTALAVATLADSGVPGDDPRLHRAVTWLLDREVRVPGDWQRRMPKTAPGGWYFEYENEFYPDTDDTAEVLTALAAVRFPDEKDEKRRRGAIERGVAWQIAMQNSNGGWPAFDRGCENEVLTFIPFADHNAMIDPSCDDITGRTLEAFDRLGVGRDDSCAPSARRAAEWLASRQESDGTWYGRWGCNYLYGTFLALRGLASAGYDLSEERFQRAGSWLRRHQNEDGGWGELPRSYDEPGRKGVGPSTPSQTAWALLGLFCLGDGSSPSVRRGLDYLLRNQRYDGSWKDETWTGTGFPSVFYLRYHLYATYFPLWALSLYEREGRRAAAPRQAEAARDPGIQTETNRRAGGVPG